MKHCDTATLNTEWNTATLQHYNTVTLQFNARNAVQCTLSSTANSAQNTSLHCRTNTRTQVQVPILWMEQCIVNAMQCFLLIGSRTFGRARPVHWATHTFLFSLSNSFSLKRTRFKSNRSFFCLELHMDGGAVLISDGALYLVQWCSYHPKELNERSMWN